jgi:hypothetical protein
MSLIRDIFFCLLVLMMTTTGQPTALRHPIVPRPEPELTIITSEMVDCATSAGSVSCLVLFVTWFANVLYSVSSRLGSDPLPLIAVDPLFFPVAVDPLFFSVGFKLVTLEYRPFVSVGF